MITWAIIKFFMFMIEKASEGILDFSDDEDNDVNVEYEKFLVIGVIADIVISAMICVTLVEIFGK